MVTPPTRRIPLLLLTLAACFGEPLDSHSEREGEYLFGLDDAEIVDVAESYGVEADVLREPLRAPFDCEAFGDLCSSVGPDAADSLVWDHWELLADGAELDDVSAQLVPTLDAAALDWEPDEAFRTYAITYYQDGSTYYRIVVNAWRYNILLTRYHKGSVSHHAMDNAGSWHLVPTDLELQVEGTRVKNGNVTFKTCSKSKWEGQLSCYRTFSLGGTHTTEATAWANGYSSTDVSG